MDVAIIDYGMGNVASVQKALNYLNISSTITCDHATIKSADSIILPGVGAFYQGMKNLKAAGLDLLLTDEVVIGKKPFLGICLGMQLLADKGYEPEECAGLGWLEGEVVKIKTKLSVPHLGWNELHSKSEFLSPFDHRDFYFIHSYHFAIKNKKEIAATVNYGEEYVAAVRKDNIFATQFHPEKSQEVGLSLISTFFESYA